MVRVVSVDGTHGRKEKVEHAIPNACGSLLKTVCAMTLLLIGLYAGNAFGQMDQGAITGVVQDGTGAIIPAAQVDLTDTDTGLVLHTTTSSSGIYVFSPVKTGHYKVSAGAPGFQTTVQENLQVNIQSTLNVVLTLKAGAANETVTVTTAPVLLETQSASIGQNISRKTIQTTPLNQNNWVYLAHLTAGVTPSTGKTRGSGTGDFMAGGQRAEQNNFMLDGVDNNVNIVDYVNGSSYAIAPPPEALSEFKVETADYSAEFGHSAGAVLNANIKSGTNQIHGSLWEYFRNTDLNAKDWNALTIPAYHMNQFGGTFGTPIIKNKLFYFGDLQDTRMAYSTVGTYSVPTPLMREGNFSELLNPALTGQPVVTLYQPGSAGATPLSCNGQANVMCANQINPVAQNILNLYPLPNANGGKTYNNLVENLPIRADPFQWDQRLDWNVSQNDQAYARYSYSHIMITNTAPLGPVLDGTTNFVGQHDNYLAQNFMLSEEHLFTPNLINEFRFAYNWGRFSNLQQNADTNLAASLGMWMPFGAGWPQNGALPSVSVSGIQSFGTHGNDPTVEVQNNYQILDNVTKIFGKHSLKFGVNFENVRVQFLQPPSSHALYTFNGTYTGFPGRSHTGSGVADFLFDQMASATMTNEPIINDQQWYDSAYVEDSWRLTNKLTVNLGLRYDYFQPYQEQGGLQSNYIKSWGTCCSMVGGVPAGSGAGTLVIPSKSSGIALPASFLNLLSSQHIGIQYTDNNRLAVSQKTNFAPRLGFAYQLTPSTVVRGGFGIFYGLIEPAGSNGNVGENFPYVLRPQILQPSCYAYNNSNPALAAQGCPSLAARGINLESGLSQQVAQGLANFVSSFNIYSIDPYIKTPYTMNYNFSVQRALSNSMTATVSYVGNVSRHLMTLTNPNTAGGLVAAGLNSQTTAPFPLLGNSNQIAFAGASTYNSLQAKLEKRFSSGLSFLSTYTFAHAMDDSVDPLGGGIGDRNTNIIPIIDEFTNSAFDVRHRVTLNGTYDLPFGIGRAHMNQSRLLDLAAGGWSTSLTYTWQTGFPFTVSPNGSIASGGSARAIVTGNPFAAGGSPNSTNANITCPTQVQTKANWYNPCAFENPSPGNTIPAGTAITSYSQAVAYLGGLSNQIYGPGFSRVNMSLFKNFTIWREQSLQFRADAFNVLNHPSWGNPSNTGINSNAGQITGPVSIQSNTPDARFFQLSLKYSF